MSYKNVVDVLEQASKSGEPKRKIIIFSEYLDTVNHLKKILEKQFGTKLLVVGGDLPSSTILQLNQNYDASYSSQKNDYDVLLATDKISEGFNLNRAGMVVNYDIPWNPVRVIQRVGRINRISKKVFEDLYIVNFFPTERGAALVQSRQIASNKMFLIHETLGEDAKIFDIDEEPTPAGLYERILQNPDSIEQESFYTKALKQYLKIKSLHPEMVEAVNNYPIRVKVAKKGINNELLVFFKKDRLYVHGMASDIPDTKPYQASFEDVFDRIVCDVDSPRLSLSEGFWENYEQVKNFKETQTVQTGEQSLENQAINNIKTLLGKPWTEVIPVLPFVKTLWEDIVDYGTLSDFTLRRIANFEVVKEDGRPETVEELNSLIGELGLDYLDKEKQRQRDVKKEIIVAIENQHNE